MRGGEIMSEYTICIPSYKRAKDCKAANWLTKAVICCHKFESEQYRKNNKNRILIMPDDLAGKGMAVIRNWIVDNVKSKNTLMIDDDVTCIGYYEDEERHKFTESQVYEFIKNGFRMCKEAGTVLWGINLLEDKKAYREYSPFSLSSVVLGPFMGIIKTHEVRFDERLGLKEDYDYSLQVLNKFRKILRFNKYHYIVGHLVGQGGCISYRTSKAEMTQRELFEKKWGKSIVRFREKDTNPVIRVPIPGI
jgi:hypothetical protein